MCTCVIQSRRRRVCLAAPKRAILTLKNLLALLFQSPARAADLCSAHTRSFKTCAWDDAGLAPHPPPLSLSSSLARSPFCLSSALGPSLPSLFYHRIPTPSHGCCCPAFPAILCRSRRLLVFVLLLSPLCPQCPLILVHRHRHRYRRLRRRSSSPLRYQASDPRPNGLCRYPHIRSSASRTGLYSLHYVFLQSLTIHSPIASSTYPP
jgi:hypothetical protein